MRTGHQSQKMRAFNMKTKLTCLLGAACFLAAMWSFAQTETNAPAPQRPTFRSSTFENAARQKLLDAYKAQGMTNETEINALIDRAVGAQAGSSPVPPSPGAPRTNAFRSLRSTRSLPTPATPDREEAQEITPTQAAPDAIPTPPVPGGSRAIPTPPVPGASRPAPTPPVPGASNDQQNLQATPVTPNVPVPPAPGIPAAQVAPQAGNDAATSSETTATINAPANDTIVPAGQIDFPNMELLQFLDIYSELIGKTILRPASLPNVTISIRSQTDLSTTEAIQALDTVMSLNGISVVPMGDKFIKVVPTAQVATEAQKFTDLDAENLPEADQMVSQIVQLQYALASEVVNAITPFAKNAAGITAIDSSNILILRDFAANVKRMLEVIEKVDVAIPRNIDLEVIPVKYALAEDLAAVLGTLTEGGTGSVPRSTTGSRLTSSQAGRTTSSSARGTTGTRTTSSLGNRGVTPQQNTATAAGGSSFQSRLQQIVQRAATPGDGESPALLGQAQILPDIRSNSLLVLGTKEEREQVKNVVAKLDTVQPQVLIEAIIMEVSLNEDFNVGVNVAQDPKTVGNAASFFGASNNTGLFSSAVTNLTAQAPGGFSYFAQLGQRWDVSVQALESDGRINVLSRPRIQTTHAVEANLFVGDTVPFVTGTFTDITGGGRSQFQNERVGIELAVLPLINQDGLVVLEILQNVAQLGVPTQIDGNDVPTTTERNAQATVAVKDGDTIMLGGFISSTKQQSESGVPFLKNIPLLGNLFRSKSDSTQRVELIVLIRPTVLPTPEIAALHAQTERDKLSAVKAAELDIREGEAERARKIEERLERDAEKKLRREEKKAETSK